MDPAKSCFYVDGPFLVYVAENKLQYFTFTTDPGPDSERLLDKFIDHAEIEDLRAKKLYNGPFEDAPESGTVHEQIDQVVQFDRPLKYLMFVCLDNFGSWRARNNQ